MGYHIMTGRLVEELEAQEPKAFDQQVEEADAQDSSDAE